MLINTVFALILVAANFEKFSFNKKKERKKAKTLSFYRNDKKYSLHHFQFKGSNVKNPKKIYDLKKPPEIIQLQVFFGEENYSGYFRIFPLGPADQ